MKKSTLIFVALVALATAATVQAQRGAGGPNYNTATEVTLNATVTEVRNIPAQGRGPGGVHLIVSADGASHEIHVGPASFMSSKGFAFAQGDPVKIIGSKVTLDEKPVVLAREITKDGKVLTLRDAKGFPLWSGRGRS